jgi:hypothetical protein
MTVQQLVDSTISLAEIKRLTLPTVQGGLGLEVNELEQALKGRIPSVINEVASVYEWDFAIKEATETTVANQDEYTLKGDSKRDALNISSIRYGSSKRLLDKKTVVAMDKTEARHTIGFPSFWTQAGRDNRYPKIRIISTPLDSTTTMTYRYWRNNVGLDEFPPPFDYFLSIALAKRMLPNMRQGIYDKALSDTIDMYDRGAGEVDVTVQDSSVITQNYRRANMFGWGGTR